MQRIAIIAGEASGDLLAARLILALKQMQPDLVFEGIAGPEMQAAGCTSLFPLDKLSVMGLVEVLKDLPALLSIRRQLKQRWLETPPDLFIGVDAPDFNLPLAASLHAEGIPTVHYVSPSIWAWREGRVKKIQGKIDLMLTLFPFEVDFYKKHQVPAQFVGHPLADELSFAAKASTARQRLGLARDQPVLGILPGSRTKEIQALGAVFIQTAQILKLKYPDLQLVLPTVRADLKARLQTIQQQVAPELPVTYVEGQSRVVMQAADYLLMASGTAVLEGMLSGRLMVAAYRVSPITWWLIHTFKLAKVNYVTLPNNLAGEELVPELLQDRANPPELAAALESLMHIAPERKAYLLERFKALQLQLRGDASNHAAKAILERFT
ncbi:lipid-A-disaccharide synthase [Thiothrix eikelboomii]|uniref:Lipid-A-disaccharide synthase n=1 Tax=Thiothrix eikelboomii TaxID=92487 RepID=A0A1T4WWV2_9GAMM|nr:lipid-A-disaccharide synthase [Thiothrix eikelboomii]SKA81852.1 lipid-A-disaccharide synthase [Thiothrix eikelboomii]